MILTDLNEYDMNMSVVLKIKMLHVVPTILEFLKNFCKVAKLKDDIIKHRLNPIASIKNSCKTSITGQQRSYA